MAAPQGYATILLGVFVLVSAVELTGFEPVTFSLRIRLVRRGVPLSRANTDGSPWAEWPVWWQHEQFGGLSVARRDGSSASVCFSVVAT